MPAAQTIEMPTARTVQLRGVSIAKPVLPRDLLRKMEYCKTHVWSNCRGTATYLIGKQDSDTALEIMSFRELYLSDMAPSAKPSQGALVAWEHNGLVGHLGLVVATEPEVRVAHRLCDLGPFFESQPFSEVDATIREFYDSYTVKDVKVVFYLPETA